MSSGCFLLRVSLFITASLCGTSVGELCNMCSGRFVLAKGHFFHRCCFLQNIFLGEDIRKQLPRESAEFDGVNKSWKEIMTRLNSVKNALRGTHHPGQNYRAHTLDRDGNSSFYFFARQECICQMQLARFEWKKCNLRLCCI